MLFVKAERVLMILCEEINYGDSTYQRHHLPIANGVALRFGEVCPALAQSSALFRRLGQLAEDFLEMFADRCQAPLRGSPRTETEHVQDRESLC